MADGVRVTVRRRFDAPPERVFDAWLDPDSARHWLFATPDGAMERVELNPRVGGRFRIDERRGGELAEHFGEYLEIDRPHRLVFSFAAIRDSGSTRVAVTIEPDGDGSLLTLVHEMDPRWADYEERTREGWTMILDGLARTLGGDSR